ncbi:MAG: DUF349 domain-containing protein, partial [Alistipes sp.]|nr:DUF349 domain-containing protein [Candidatus Minthomonas equi]
AAGCYPQPEEQPEVSEITGDDSGTLLQSDEKSTELISQNPFAQVERGFKTLYAKYRSLRNAYLAQVEKNKEENLTVKLQIIEELKNLVENQEDLSKTFPAFRAIQARWRESGPVPAKNVKDIYETYQHNVEKFYDYVKINNELRDLDFKKNLEIKERLCTEAEALIEEDNVVNAFARLQKLHEEWKELGPVDKEHRESIWERFKEATASINKKHQAHFEGLKEQQKENLVKKTALCEKVEAIAEAECSDSSQWNAASKQIEDIQKEWKTIGFAAKKDNQKIYDRFRAACDKFFERKRVYYSEFKDSMLKNYEAKVALCEQAEILSESTDWKNSKDALIELQKKWKEIGPVSRKKSDAIWNRFRAACDKFFDNKEKNFGGVDSQFVENLHKKLALIEEIKGYEPASDRSDLDALKNFTNAWNEIGFVPFREKEKVQEAYRTALNEKFPEYRSGAEGRKRSDRTIRNADSGKSERDKLLQKYHKIESEIATYENNMGFFANSKNAEVFINGILQKIDAAKAELAELEEKIKTLE